MSAAPAEAAWAPRQIRLPPDLHSLAWRPLHIPATELRLSTTLFSGQCFRWRTVSVPGLLPSLFFVGWILRRHLVLLREEPDNVSFFPLGVCIPDPRQQQQHPVSTPESEVEADIRRYFNLHVSLKTVYEHCAQRCPSVFGRAIAGQKLTGTRIMSQDPYETLLTFICTANNNVGRITGMVERFCEEYGTHYADLLIEGYPCPASSCGKGQADPLYFRRIFTFPSLDRLRETVTEERLRELGFGYRARSIVETVNALDLEDLAMQPQLNLLSDDGDDVVLQRLMKYRGVGPKVASCIALFSLDRHDLVPVDTHIWQHSLQHLLTARRRGSAGNKAPTPEDMKLVRQMWRERYGPWSGWAQQVLFADRILPATAPAPAAMTKEDSGNQAETPPSKRRNMKHAHPATE